MKRLAVFAALAASVVVPPLAAQAAAIDATKPILCVTLEVFECAPGQECFQGRPSDINAPLFIRLDLPGKNAQAKRPDGELTTSPINAVSEDGGNLILQGAQNGRGWNMTLAQETGSMTLAATGENIAFVLFGSCTGL